MINPGCLFSIVKKNEKQLELDLQFPVGSYWFDGHFPGNPIVPGIAFVFFIKNCFIESFCLPKESVVNVVSARFKKIVKPEVPLHAILNLLTDSEVSFRILEKVSGKIVATGKLEIH
ncbi:MAG: hypothetical protein PF637_03610 [Spirochaetes bacterium]|jgi:3-hydroxyacyl-[acyl-carrier-protein] dehydratase|nr:hypothetical protein [Spirochaetota bacterium]